MNTGKSNKKKRWLWIASSIVLLVILLSLILGKGKKHKEVQITKVSKRNITEIVSVSGKIQPENEIKISADVSGEITQMAVKEGDSVKAGQLLCTINPEIYASQINQLNANVQNAKANLAASQAQKSRLLANLSQAEANFNRQKQLFEQKVISAQEFEQAKSLYEGAVAEIRVNEQSAAAAGFTVNAAVAQLEQGQKNLNRTNIYAPHSGIVTGLQAEKGERVVGTAQMAGTEIMRVSNLNIMEVQISVNENDIVRIQVGDSADVNVDAYGDDRIFAGVVTEIANSAKFNVAQTIDNQAVNFTVKVRLLPHSYTDLLSKNKHPFFPGMSATVNIKTETVEQALSIPITAVTTRNPVASENKKTDSKTDSEKNDNHTWVFIFDRNSKTVKAKKVKLGLQDLDYFEIKDGLIEGQEIISEPAMTIAKDLMDGETVSILEKSKERN